MKLPVLDTQKRYDGLYVVDFGDQVGVGYTVEEVGFLLESEKYPDVKVYKIHQFHPDGTVELKGVSSSRFNLENGFFFCSADTTSAQSDFDEIARLSESSPLPCRARLELGRLGYQPRWPYVVALIYPAEYEDEVSRWLLDMDYRGGEAVEGGFSHLENFQKNAIVTLSRQLACQAWRESRTREEVLQAVGIAVQR